MKQMAKMPFAKDDHMVETVPPDRTNQPLYVSERAETGRATCEK